MSVSRARLRAQCYSRTGKGKNASGGKTKVKKGVVCNLPTNQYVSRTDIKCYPRSGAGKNKKEGKPSISGNAVCNAKSASVFGAAVKKKGTRKTFRPKAPKKKPKLPALPKKKKPQPKPPLPPKKKPLKKGTRKTYRPKAPKSKPKLPALPKKKKAQPKPPLPPKKKKSSVPAANRKKSKITAKKLQKGASKLKFTQLYSMDKSKSALERTKLCGIIIRDRLSDIDSAMEGRLNKRKLEVLLRFIKEDDLTKNFAKIDCKEASTRSMIKKYNDKKAEARAYLKKKKKL